VYDCCIRWIEYFRKNAIVELQKYIQAMSAMVKSVDGVTYVFTSAMWEKKSTTTVSFKLKDSVNAFAEVIGESCKVEVKNGECGDSKATKFTFIR